MVIKHKNIILRDMQKNDIENYVRWFTQDLEWAKSDSPWEPVESDTETERKSWSEYYETVKELPENLKRHKFEIEHNDRHIGWVCSYFIDKNYEWTESSNYTETVYCAVGIDICESDIWGKGVGSNALFAYINYLFESGISDIYTQTWSGNLGMIKCAAKLGFTECNRNKENREVEGKKYDGLTFKLTREGFIYNKIRDVLLSMNFCTADEKFYITPFVNCEDGEEYNVWKITKSRETYVLKKSKGCEDEIYSAFLGGDMDCVPRVLCNCTVDGEKYLLMEYVNGKDLYKCDRNSLIKALDALIELQKKYWNDKEKSGLGYTYEKSFEGRKNRGKYLCDPELEKAYSEFLLEYEIIPRTLCHDDLLPFNILINDNKAVIIDWELAGILPYPSSLARLIAHCEEDANAFFYMTESDRRFAIDYYYENLVQDKNISYARYRSSIDKFLLYEYCEWIMLGNKYQDADMVRYEHYLGKAKAHIKRMKEGNSYEK